AQRYAAGDIPVSVAVGDFNGDGHSDLAVANLTDNGAVSVLLGNGDGTFQSARSYAAGSRPSSLAVGDFNSDGHLDIAVVNGVDIADNRTVIILLGNDDGTFQSPQNYAVGRNPDFVAVADFRDSVVVGEFDGDGHLDLAVVNGATAYAPRSTVSVLLGKGDG